MQSADSSLTADTADTADTAAPVSQPVPQATADLVDAWFGRHFHNLGAGLTEELYNRIYAAKDDLKVTLAAAGAHPTK